MQYLRLKYIIDFNFNKIEQNKIKNISENYLFSKNNIETIEAFKYEIKNEILNILKGSIVDVNIHSSSNNMLNAIIKVTYNNIVMECTINDNYIEELKNYGIDEGYQEIL